LRNPDRTDTDTVLPFTLEHLAEELKELRMIGAGVLHDEIG
jgi:hypothetical protein